VVAVVVVSPVTVRFPDTVRFPNDEGATTSYALYATNSTLSPFARGVSKLIVVLSVAL
jgi:hypothetical protein